MLTNRPKNERNREVPEDRRTRGACVQPSVEVAPWRGS